VIRPKNLLEEGSQILRPVLRPHGFRFRFRGEGRGSGGNFAAGEFVRWWRRLELHFRQSLGLVRYHVGHQSASHESYMRELGVWEHCQYPSFSDDPLKAFDGLAHDLNLADDFLVGSAAILRKAAAKEAADATRQREAVMARYAGDTSKLDELRANFHEKHYTEVIKLFGELTYPNQLTASELRMVEIARRRVGGIDDGFPDNS
jgi:hypothetical protein